MKVPSDRTFFVFVVVVLVVVNLLLLFYPSSDNAHNADIEADPNAPVILVAEDPSGNTNNGNKQRQSGEGHSRRRGQRLQEHQGDLGVLRLLPESVATRFLVVSVDHGGGGMVSEAAFNLLHHQIFFLHQPLHSLARREHRSLDKHRGEEGLRWLHQIYNCSLAQHYDLLYEPHLLKSNSIQAAYNSVCHTRDLDLVQCAEWVCRSRHLRAAFTTHLPARLLPHLLQQYSTTLKVVVVLRDPRAVLNAHYRFSRHKHTPELHNEAREVCLAMAEVVYQASQLHARYPGAVLVLHYEHLVLRPHKLLPRLYTFLGFQATKEQISSVMLTLRLNHREELRLQTLKMWQLGFTLQESRAVDRGCSRYYNILGYLPVPRKLTYRNNLFVEWEET